MMKLSFLVLFIFNFLMPLDVQAFPEMVRHGYVNCTSCHVSPSGGGLLNNYGKVISDELLSFWVTEEDLKEPKASDFSFNFGGEARAVQTYLDTPVASSGRFILMQTDIEAAVTYLKKLILVSSFGFEDKGVTTEKEYKFISRRHYVNYWITDNFSLRAGKFSKAFGINGPNHTIVTKRGLNWDFGSESYNIEIASINEQYDLFLTGIFGRPDDESLDREKAYSISSSYSFLSKYKVGASFFSGENSSTERTVAGVFGILGFTEHLFLLSEIDYQSKKAKAQNSNVENGMVTYQRLNYEYKQGLHFYLPYEYSLLNDKDSNSKFESYGVGIQFFPRKHFEINFEFLKQQMKLISDKPIDFAFLLFHIYL